MTPLFDREVDEGDYAVSSTFPRPPKPRLTVQLDADVIAWLKKDSRGWHDRANQMLRERMLAELKQA